MLDTKYLNLYPFYNSSKQSKPNDLRTAEWSCFRPSHRTFKSTAHQELSVPHVWICAKHLCRSLQTSPGSPCWQQWALWIFFFFIHATWYTIHPVACPSAVAPYLFVLWPLRVKPYHWLWPRCGHGLCSDCFLCRFVSFEGRRLRWDETLQYFTYFKGF